VKISSGIAFQIEKIEDAEVEIQSVLRQGTSCLAGLSYRETGQIFGGNDLLLIEMLSKSF
jgi:hypothetical protein